MIPLILDVFLGGDDPDFLNPLFPKLVSLFVIIDLLPVLLALSDANGKLVRMVLSVVERPVDRHEVLSDFGVLGRLHQKLLVQRTSIY